MPIATLMSLAKSQANRKNAPTRRKKEKAALMTKVPANQAGAMTRAPIMSPVRPEQKAAAVKPPRQTAQPQRTQAASQANRATLVNPQTGERRAVGIGGDDARKAFGEGFHLEGSAELKAARKQMEQKRAADAPKPPEPSKIEAPERAVRETREQEPASAIKAAQTPTQSQIDVLRANYLESLTPTERERQLQDELASFRESARLGLEGLEGQGRGIPLQLVRGQQEDLLEQSGIREQTLIDRLTAEQAARQSRGQQALAAMGIEQQDRQLAQQEAAQQQNLITSMLSSGFTPVTEGAVPPEGAQLVNIGGESFYQLPEAPKPIVVGGRLVTPTGEVLYEPPAGAQIEKVGDTLLERDPATGEYRIVYSAPKDVATGIEMPSIKEIGGESYVWDSTSGSFKKLDVPNQESKKTIEGSKTLYDLANQLLQDPALEAATGPLGQFVPSLKSLTGKTGEFKRKMEQLISLLSLENTSKLKGAISDAELALLRSAGTSLDLGQTTTQFRNELQSIMEKALKAQYNAAGFTGKTFEEALAEDGPEVLQQIINQAITAPVASVGFNQVGGDTNVAAIAEAIGQFESGNNYQAQGPVVQSGMYKGERALGKYQIMPGNLPQWSMETVGRVVTPQEFLQNPRLQDQIAIGKMQDIYARYGTPEDVASVWFTGRPYAQVKNNPKVRDVIGTTADKYVANIQANLRG